MNRVPVESLSAQNPAIDTFVDGEHLLQMHPSSVMTFVIDQPVHTVSAAFGLMPGAEAGPNGTLGVEFIVEWQSADGRTERLYSRLLDPRNHAEDRARQTAKVGPVALAITANFFSGPNPARRATNRFAGPIGRTWKFYERRQRSSTWLVTRNLARTRDAGGVCLDPHLGDDPCTRFDRSRSRNHVSNPPL